MKIDKKGFVIFTLLIVTLFLSVAYVENSYKKSLSIKTLYGQEKILSDQNLLLINTNIISSPNRGSFNDSNLFTSEPYLIKGERVVKLDIKKQDGFPEFYYKDTKYSPNLPNNLVTNDYYTYKKSKDKLVIKFDDYKGREYSAYTNDENIKYSARSSKLILYRIEKYKDNYYCLFSYYNKDLKSSMLTFARIDRDKLTILGQVKDNNNLVEYKQSLVAFDKFFLFDQNNLKGNIVPSIVYYDFKTKKIERKSINKGDPSYNIFSINQNNYDDNDKIVYKKYLSDKNSLIIVKNSTYRNRCYVYTMHFKDGSFILDSQVDTGIKTSNIRKNIRYMNESYAFDNSNRFNILTNNNKLILYNINNTRLINTKKYQNSLTLDPVEKIIIYNLDTKKIDYEGLISGGLRNRDTQIYATTPIR